MYYLKSFLHSKFKFMLDLMQPGFKTYNATIAGEKRTFSVEVPAGFNPETGMVLAFFKGKGGASADKLVKLFSETLKKNNCIGIYPNAVKRGKTPAQWALDGENFNKDYLFYNYIVDQIPDDMPVCLSGVSNGGCFSLLLTCIGAGLATCTFAASLWKGIEVKYPSNVYAIHGRLDTSVPYYGGDAHGYEFLPAEQSIQLFVPEVNRTVCTKPMPGSAKLTTYEAFNISQLLSVENSGHDVMTSYKGMNLIDSMFEFFTKFV